MDKQEQTAFAQANERMHPVEKQWHFKPLTDAGFVPMTREAAGFVRRYDYEHPDGRAVSCHTGASSDYWVAGDKRGYWGELESWCKSQ
jgi:hypothetical protein